MGATQCSAGLQYSSRARKHSPGILTRCGRRRRGGWRIKYNQPADPAAIHRSTLRVAMRFCHLQQCTSSPICPAVLLPVHVHVVGGLFWSAQQSTHTNSRDMEIVRCKQPIEAMHAAGLTRRCPPVFQGVCLREPPPSYHLCEQSSVCTLYAVGASGSHAANASSLLPAQIGLCDVCIRGNALSE